MKLQFITLRAIFTIIIFLGSLYGMDSTESVIHPTKTKWKHISSRTGDLPDADVGAQVSTLIMDIDKDGKNDFVIAGWGKPSMVWFRRSDKGWTRYVIDKGIEYIEAGGTFTDIDGDGDLDIVQGGDYRTLKEVWWWENPYPDFDPEKPWNRYFVKNSDEGGKGHHDQIFGDFDGDGDQELVFWNTSICKLYFAEIPENPKTVPAWDLHLITQFDVPEQGKYEGLAKEDIDLDGTTDIVGGGSWYRHETGNKFSVHAIDPEYYGSRSAVGDIIKGGHPEVVLSSGDHYNSLNIYELKEGKWHKTELKENVNHGHTLQVADIDNDGNLDIFCAEMADWRKGRTNENAKCWIFYGDGKGNFDESIISESICHHESKVGDLDGDGDLDILGKPFVWKDSPIEIWLNQGKESKIDHQASNQKVSNQQVSNQQASNQQVNFLARKIDGPAEKWYGPFSEGSAVFDIDKDGILDITAGPNWYQGPDFKRKPLRHVDTVGEFVNNSGDHPYDVNGDGWTDIISNGWFEDLNVYWYEHPRNMNGIWKKHLIAESEKTEFLICEDIDGDGDTDVLPNHWSPTSYHLFWLEYKNGGYVKHVVGENGDRHGLAIGDINGDGRKDIVTRYGWYEGPEQYDDGTWQWHPEYRIEPSSSIPMLVYDVNKDDLNDIIYGAGHDYGLFWMEQITNNQWITHTIDTSWSQVHHLVLHDINADGSLDLITGKRLRGHRGKDPGSAEPLGLYWYSIDRENATFTKHVIAYNAMIGTGMQINIKDIDNDNDVDIIVSGKSGLYLLENMTYFNKSEEINRLPLR